MPPDIQLIYKKTVSWLTSQKSRGARLQKMFSCSGIILFFYFMSETENKKIYISDHQMVRNEIILGKVELAKIYFMNTIRWSEIYILLFSVERLKIKK